MRKRYKPAARLSAPASFVLAMLLFAIAPAAFGQALPAAEASPISTGFALPMVAGTFQYAITASESLSWGFYSNSGVSTGTSLSGDAAYISSSLRAPFSMVVAGGALRAPLHPP